MHVDETGAFTSALNAVSIGRQIGRWSSMRFMIPLWTGGGILGSQREGRNEMGE